MPLKRENLEEIRKERIKKWKKGKKQPPLKVGLYPTFRCNLSCIFCRGAKYRNEERFVDLKEETWINFIRQATDLGARWWYISGGGEPFMLKKTLFKILEEINKSSKKSFKKIITNGTLLNKGNARKTVKAGVDEILLSLDGTKAEVHDRLRGRKGAFKKVLNGLKNLDEEKLGRNRPKVILNSIVHSKNFKNLSNYLEIAKEYNVNGIALHPLKSGGVEEKIGNLLLKGEQKEEIRGKIKELRNAADGTDINLDVSALEDFLENGRKKNTGNKNEKANNWINKAQCFEPIYTMLVDHWGNVAPCISMGEGYESMNITEKSVEDIWYSDFFEKMRNKVIDGHRLEFCDRCGKQNETETIRKQLKS